MIGRSGWPIFAFSLILYSGVWVSKTVHPMFFHETDDLALFGVSYSVMAATGIFSFYFGQIISRMPLKKAILYGCMIYSVGMSLRMFPNFTAAVATGVISGVGASITFICLSSWPFSADGDEERDSWYAYTIWASNIARGVILCMAAYFTAIFAASNGLQILLLASAVCPLLGFFLVARWIPSDLKPQGKKSSFIATLRETNPVIIRFSFYSVAAGLLVSLVLPYIPIMAVEAGLSDTEVLTLVGVSSLIVVATQPMVLSIGRVAGPAIFFGFSTLGLSISTALLAFDGVVWLLCIWVCLRYIAANCVHLSQRMVEMRVVERSEASTSMGMLQSAFLIGDMMGGALAGLIWTFGNPYLILPIVSLMVVLNGLYFLIVFVRAKEAFHQRSLS